MNELAKNRGQTLAQMALSWVLRDGEVTSVLIGASKPEQILENLEIVGHTSFTEEELRAIDAISPRNKQAKRNFSPLGKEVPFLRICLLGVVFTDISDATQHTT